MAVLKMQKINLCAMKKNRKRILEAVQAMGVVEVSSWQDEMEGFRKWILLRKSHSLKRRQQL